MKQGRREHFSTGGQEQLPFVSVFLVLVCLFAALNSLSAPSQKQFGPIQDSLKETFGLKKSKKDVVKQRFDAETAQAIDALCTSFSARCMQVENKSAVGTLLDVPALRFSASQSGLSATGTAFLRGVGDLKRHTALVVPSAADLAGADITILLALLEEYSGKQSSVIQSDALVKGAAGFLIMPTGDMP
ncbi:MAG: hypothetical protein AAF337_07205 [Pseudomonadota bacterium]